MSIPPAILAGILDRAPTLHRAGTFSRRVLEAIVKHGSARTVQHSVETGSGASTLLFSHLSDHHTVFALDDGTDSINAVRTSPLLRPGVVTFVEGSTQLTLPAHTFAHKLQLALIDGPHAYPFPDLEYYHLYEHLDAGAVLIVDDIHIRSINNLFEFLRADDMFTLLEVAETTAFFERTTAPVFSRTGDGWWMQGYNRQDFEVTPAVAGRSDRLERVEGETAPCYLDELGQTANPSRQLFLSIPASTPLQVSGWAIDAAGDQPAAWVEIVLNGEPYRTEVRVPRGDVAAAHGFQFLRSGFRTTLPAEKVPPGKHRLSLRVILRDGRRFVETPALALTAR